MQKEIKKFETPNDLIIGLHYINRLVWLLGVVLFLWAILGGERALINAVIIIAVIYLIKE